MPTGLWWYVTPSPAFGLRHCLASNLFAIRHAALQESKWYNFKRFILLTRVYSDPAAAAAAGGGDTAAAGPSSSRPPAGPSAPQKKKKQKGEGSKVRLYRQQVLPKTYCSGSIVTSTTKHVMIPSGSCAPLQVSPL